MRIGIFTDYFLPHIGGVETSIFHQQRALKTAGHQVFIITPPMRGAGVIDDKAENVVRIKSPINIHFDGMGVYFYNRYVFAVIDRLNLDIVHAETEFNMAALAVRYARARRKPLFYTAHTFVTPQIELLMKHPMLMARLAIIGQKIYLGKMRPKNQYAGVDGLFGIPCATPAEKIILDVWMKLIKLVDIVLAPSQRMIDYIGHYQPDKRRYLIPNPYSSQLTDNLTPTPVHSPINIISSVRLSKEKRPHILVEAMTMLSPEERAQLKIDIYGGGEMHGYMQKLIHKHKMQDSIIMHGSVDNLQVQKAMADADIVASTSIGFDNQPMVILEGIHAGNAILYCDEYLREGTDGGNSILVDPTVEGFTRGLRTIISQPNDITLMKQASKQLAKQFTYQSYVTNFEKILAELKKPAAPSTQNTATNQQPDYPTVSHHQDPLLE